ncbi:HD family phosphohydrolase [Planctomycetota bacterium]
MPQITGRKQKQSAKQKGPAGKGNVDGITKRVILGGVSIAVVSIVVGIYGPGRAGVSLFGLDGEYGRWVGLGILVVVLVSLYMIYLAKFHRDVLSSHGRWLRIVLIFLVYLLGARFLLDAEVSIFLIPSSLFALLFALLHGRRFAVIALAFLAVLCAVLLDADPAAQLVLFLGGVVVVFGSVPIASRWKLMATGLVVAAVQCVVLLSLWLAGMSGHEIPKDGFPWNELMWGGLMGFAYIGILANAFLPLIEYAFDVTTHMTLLEISSQNQPLVRRMIMEAPGTYHHSLVVGNLAESAAEAVGADWLLARVGAYYHDIGKLGKPLYFTENTMNIPDRHENLSPAMSTLIITAHTKDGVQIGRNYSLPKNIIDFVEQHHGNSTVDFFYQQALARSDEDNKPSAEEFRYPGPRPRSKEVGIVLLADAAEAATRSLTEPNPSRIENLVRDVIAKRIVDGQLDDCPLTLDDLRKVRRSFVRVLTGMYHSRVRYPGTEQSANGD